MTVSQTLQIAASDIALYLRDLSHGNEAHTRRFSRKKGVLTSFEAKRWLCKQQGRVKGAGEASSLQVDTYDADKK